MNLAPITRVTRVVAGILVRGDEILCCRRSETQPHPLKWEFPGGKIDPGESPEQALIRELEEELGIQTEVGERVALITHSYVPGSAVELHFFRIDRWKGEVENRVFGEICWMKRPEMRSLDFLEADLELVRQIALGKIL